MTKWKLYTYCVDIIKNVNCDPALIWTQKDEKTGETVWEELNKLAADGWELVSVSPLAVPPGTTGYILYTFKRPQEDKSSV